MTRSPPRAALAAGVLTAAVRARAARGCERLIGRPLSFESRGCGGTGRRVGFRTRWAMPLEVRVLSPALPRSRDDRAAAISDNRGAMDVALAPPAALPGPISPELVLVSPPEVARLARSLLSPDPPAAIRASGASEREFGAVELTAVWFFSVAATVGPLLLYLLAGRTG